MEARTVQKHLITLCPICGTRRFRYLFSVGAHRLERCNDCHFTLLNPQPSNEELGAIYSQNYFLGAGDAEKQSAFAQLKLRTAETYLDELNAYAGLRSGKLLEIGCGSGDMLMAAARRGFAVTGVEFSEHACATARSRLATEGFKGELVCGEIDAIADRVGQFDVCVMADLIEHVRDPRHFVEVLHRVLKPDGVIFIATPSVDSWSARFTSKKWMEFKPEHLSYFSRKTLEGLLFSEGFRSLTWKPGYKILNYDYIQGHFEKFPVPLFTSAVKMFGACLPAGSRTKERRVVASGMVMMGRRNEKPLRLRLSVIVPVFNEAATFRTSFSRVLAHPLPKLDVEYVVVESNSTDGTRDEVKRFADHPGVRLVFEEKPMGKGHAVRAGLKAAKGDFIIIQDADLEYDLDDYEALLEPLISNREAFVLGARHGGRAWKMRQFAGQPLTSLVLNFGHWFFTWLLNVFYFVRLKDPFTMYKVFRKDCIHNLRFEANRFDFDWELVIKLIRKGYTPIELPVNYRSRSFREGKKVSVIRDPISWFVAVIKFRFQRL
jgi:2-polyprenyl-3-methyl-5-hydroxy-6-metoxy-1,4-benzoquinol methylase